MNKNIKKLFILIIFFAIAEGMFYNLLELWIQNNNMTITTTSRVLSLSALITVSVIFLCSNLIKTKNLKRFISTLLFIRVVVLIALHFLYQTGYNIPIKFLIMVDYALSVETLVSIYPLMSFFGKDDKLYAKKNLLYEIFYYIASFATGFLVGKTIFNYQFNYNSYTLLSALCFMICYIALYKVEIPNKKVDDHNNLLINFLSKVKKDKISHLYFGYVITNDISFYALSGMLITILTKNFNLEPSLASNIKLAFAIVAVGIGALILYKLTLKNNYINLSIKLVGRIICYLLVVIYCNSITIIIGLLYTVLTSSAYGHVTDAPYINRFNNEEQLAFANLHEMIVYASRALGTFICGLGIVYGLRYNFIIAFVFTSICTIFAILARYYLEKERR